MALLLASTPAHATAERSCQSLFDSSPTTQSRQPIPFAKRTRIEDQFPLQLPPLSASERLREAIAELEKTNPELAAKATEAKRRHDRGISLKLDLSPLPTHMVYFLEGAFREAVGPRGLSEPFVELRKLNEQTLFIHHAGDRYPLVVRWSADATSPRRAREEEVDGQKVRLLELPQGLKSRRDLSTLPKKFIYSLISASRLNRHISASGSPEMTIASLLHDGRLNFDRPTQQDFKEVRKAFDTDAELRKAVRSLLFVASTASGKTRILAESILSRLTTIRERLSANPGYKKKLVVLTTKTPDLTAELAREIGGQINNTIGARNYRLVQWGGELSEVGALGGLNSFLDFVEKSDVPVVLVTSYPTLASRIESDDAMKRLFKPALGLAIDETHNSTGTTFSRVMNSALRIASDDRQGSVFDSLDILGVTASPVGTVSQTRTVEIFDATFWASIDKATTFAKKIERAASRPWPGRFKDVLDWKRILEQYTNARDRGEINAPDSPIYYRPEERGFSFTSIFKRGQSGTQPYVDLEKVKLIWPDIASLIGDHGSGVIHTYPRDADNVAKTLSELTGRNFVSLRSLNAGDRAEVYEAFRNGKDFRGAKVFAIVGSIREGLDFPKAGWYLSFKKYVRFPENLQGPGRVVRLALDKLPPVIIFFGKEIDRIAYEDVRDLILRHMGKLPAKFANGRFYKGARRADAERPLGKAIEEANTALEALLRIRSDLTAKLGDHKNPDPAALAELQTFVRTTRLTRGNREVAESLTRLMVAANSYPFFQGDLGSTWKYCTKLLAAAKEGPGPRMSDDDRAVLSNPALMERVKEFRDTYAWMGTLPRAIIEGVTLRPNNLAELAQAIDGFVAFNGKVPYSTSSGASSDASSLATLMHLSIQTSSKTLWSYLNHESRQKLDSLFARAQGETFETVLAEFFLANASLPEIRYDMIDNPERTVEEGNETRVAERLSRYLHEGELDIRALKGNPKLLEALDQSRILERAAKNAATALTLTIGELVDALGNDAYRLRQESVLTYENFMRYEQFGVLRIIKEMAELKLPNAKAFRDEIERLIESEGGD
jgi:hypothetical protein